MSSVRDIEAANEMWGMQGYDFFTYGEFCCKCDHCVSERADGVYSVLWFQTPEFRAFMERLISLRMDCGFPFPVNSGWRCEQHPIEAARIAKGKPPGPHFWGAADIRASFERAYTLMATAMQRGMGIGSVQHGPVGNRFVHVDNQGMRVWTYDRG